MSPGLMPGGNIGEENPDGHPGGNNDWDEECAGEGRGDSDKVLLLELLVSLGVLLLASDEEGLLSLSRSLSLSEECSLSRSLCRSLSSLLSSRDLCSSDLAAEGGSPGNPDKGLGRRPEEEKP